MANHRWNYCGDINLECGGFFWQKDSHANDFVYAVEVIPVSDLGGPDNQFIIQWGASIYINYSKIDAALATCGYKINDKGRVIDGMGHVCSKADSFKLIVEAFRAYYGMEGGANTTIQIGKTSPYDKVSEFNPEEILRGNTNLMNYVRKNYLT